MSRTKEAYGGWTGGGSGRSQWRDASAHHRCPVCKSDSYCQIHRTEPVVLCKRVASDHAKKNIRGVPFFVHHLDGHSSTWQPDDTGPAAAPNADRAPNEVLDQFYRALLADLSLSESHRAALLERGLGSKDIDAGLYRTLPLEGRSRLAKRLVERFGELSASAIPGLYVKPKDDKSWWTIAGSPGLVIPVVNRNGQVIALKVRRDEEGKGNRYSYISSKKHGGASPAQAIHLPPGTYDRTTVRIIEGELKAHVCTVRTGIFTIAVPGAGNWRDAPEAVRALGASTVLVAYDQDPKPETRKRVKGYRNELVRALAKVLEPEHIGIETWPLDAGKGLDDVIASGRLGDVETQWNTTPQEESEHVRETAGVRRARIGLETAVPAVTVTREEAQRQMSEAIEEWKPGERKALQSSCGSGKNFSIRKAAQKGNRRYLIGGPSYELAQQNVVEAQKIGVSAEIREGVLRSKDANGNPNCKQYERASVWQKHGGSVTRDMCSKCEHYDGCSARGKDNGAILVATHSSMVKPIGDQIEEKGHPFAPIYDECFTVFVLNTITPDDLSFFDKVLTDEESVRREHCLLASSVRRSLDPWCTFLRNALASDQRFPFDERIAAAAKEYETNPLTRSWLPRAEDSARSRYDKATNRYVPDEQRTASFNARAKAWGGGTVARARAAAASLIDRKGSYLANPEELHRKTDLDRAARADKVARLLVDAAFAKNIAHDKRGVEFVQPTQEARYFQKNGGIALDATLPLLELKALCPDLRLLTLSVSDGTPGTERVLLYASDATKKRLLPDKVIEWNRVETLVREGLARATKKGVRKLLIGSFREIVSHIKNRTAPASVLALIDGWSAFRDLDFAYYGNIRGMDTWESFDGFLSIGDFRLPVHVTQAIAREISVDPRALSREQAGGQSAQFHGRARDPGRTESAWHCHIGQVPPVGWHNGNCTFERLVQGRPKTEAAMTAEEFAGVMKVMGWTVRSAAKALGISDGAVSQYCNGKRAVPADLAEKARAYATAMFTKVPTEEEDDGSRKGISLGTFVNRRVSNNSNDLQDVTHVAAWAHSLVSKGNHLAAKRSARVTMDELARALEGTATAEVAEAIRLADVRHRGRVDCVPTPPLLAKQARAALVLAEAASDAEGLNPWRPVYPNAESQMPMGPSRTIRRLHTAPMPEHGGNPDLARGGRMAPWFR